jgi:indole-3-glycerol phosphate synthase
VTDILQKICAATRAEIAKRKKKKSFSVIDAEARGASKLRGFTRALRRKVDADGIALITEIKRASPSAGVIRKDFSPAALAKAYADAGAACLSVLTDGPYFKGRNEDLIAARAACALPVLRKDFMLDVWQMAEARAIGADCILLIMAALDDEKAADLHDVAEDYGMDVLIEVHNRAELDRALALPSGLIGINNRDLKTLKVDLVVTEELMRHVPRGRLVVSESGIATAADIARLRKVGVNCFLVGESLLKQQDIKKATRNLLLA